MSGYALPHSQVATLNFSEQRVETAEMVNLTDSILEKAVDEVMKITANPAKLPTRPAAPVKTNQLENVKGRILFALSFKFFICLKILFTTLKP